MNYAPIDADGHVMETDDELRRYLPAPFEGRRALTALFPSLDGWPRSTRKPPDNTPCLQKWRMFLDGSGVAGSVLYPTMGLAMAHIKDVKWAPVMARCYNDYLYGEYLEKEPRRLWGVALLPVQDITAAAEDNPELRQMQRRFWVSVALSAPLVLIAMAHAIPAGWTHALAASPADSACKMAMWLARCSYARSASVSRTT